MNGNAVVRRFAVNNLVIPSLGAVANVNVDVAVTAGMVATDDVGFAICQSDPGGIDGIPAIIPVNATSATNIRFTFTNASAGAIDPADTLDFIVYMFSTTGNVAQTV